MAAVRQLYDPGFEDWDHSVACYMTDYGIAGSCAILLIITMLLGRKSPLREVIAFLGFSCAGYACAGIAHHILDGYFSRNESANRSFASPNSEWMYFWILSLACLAFAHSCLVATVSVTSGLHRLVRLSSYGVGLAVSGYEVYTFGINEDTYNTGRVANTWGLIATVVSMACILLGVCWMGCGGCGGRLLLFLGACSIKSGISIAMYAPSSCKHAAAGKLLYVPLGSECPFSESFNHNAVCHSCILAGSILVTAGVLWIWQAAPSTSTLVGKIGKPQSRREDSRDDPETVPLMNEASAM